VARLVRVSRRPFGVQAPQGVGHGGPPRHMRARGASRPVFTPTFSPAFLFLSPNRIVLAALSPSGSPRRPPPAATSGDTGQIGSPVTQADGRPAHGTKDAPRRSPARSPLRPPNRRPMRARSPACSPLRPRRRMARRPFPPAFTSSSPQTRIAGRPTRWPFTPSSPGPAHVGHDEDGASDRRRWRA
jgi:hypothetical protein